MLEKFADRTAGENTLHNRLITRETDSGNVALIGYGWIKLAEYNESRGVVTVFTGHAALRSKTVSRWLNEAIDVAQERGRDVYVSGESPVVDTPNDTTHYISSYISFSANKSAVEQDAEQSVRESLAHLA